MTLDQAAMLHHLTAALANGAIVLVAAVYIKRGSPFF